MTTTISRLNLEAELRRFGHDSFRPGQERVVRGLLEGRDALVVMPTGAGKSLIYQVVAQLLPGVTIVVSPLIALMKDQVESVESRGVEAGFINSTQSERQAEQELREVEDAEAKLLYVTPERFGNEEFMAEMRDLEVSLFVVDEAHSISEWGHDFRPAYLSLGSAAARLGSPTILALTATATPWVRREVIERLGMRDPAIFVHGTDRPNLYLEVRRVEEETDKRRVLENLLFGDPAEDAEDLEKRLHQAVQGSGIVYTATTKAAEETATWLQEQGIAADYYHGQRKKSDRDRVQEAFMNGELRVIAATNAFGMGVDKPDVRFVIHHDIPANLEAYYQEAGRAGRDGDFARCVIIYRPKDLGRAAFFSGSGKLTREDIEGARASLRAKRRISLQELDETTGLSKGDLARVLTVLERDGIAREEDGHIRMLVPDFDPEQVSLDQEEHRRAYERSRVEMMRAYAELDRCRREYILNYFGQEYEAGRCDMCDNDVLRRAEPHDTAKAEVAVDSPYSMGDEVVHDALGAGVVQRLEDDRITVLFEGAGYKTLSLDLVLAQGLLKPKSE